MQITAVGVIITEQLLSSDPHILFLLAEELLSRHCAPHPSHGLFRFGSYGKEDKWWKISLCLPVFLAS